MTLTAIALGVVVIAVLTVMYTKAESQPDSVRQACEAFDEAVQATEKNNAVYAYLMKHGFESEYTTMKDSLLTELNNGSMTASSIWLAPPPSQAPKNPSMMSSKNTSAVSTA